MLSHRRGVPVSFVLALCASAALAQPPSTLPKPSPTPPPPVLIEGYLATVEIKASAPSLKSPQDAAPEAQALIGRLKDKATLTTRIYMARDISRQEIVSTDFLLPAGTIILHKAGDRYYAIADPKAKSYLVMDAEQLLSALEGGAGILNSKYDARVTTSQDEKDKKTIAGMSCRKSILTVTYVSSIPYENERVLVQQKNAIEIWHTSGLVSSAVMDHFFFKFQRDKTGTVQRAVSESIGFPMEMHMTVTQGTGQKQGSADPGAIDMLVTEVKKEPKLDAALFAIPPVGFTRTDKAPWFKQ